MSRDRRDEDDAGERAGYVIAICEGAECVPMLTLPPVRRRVAVGWLGELAAGLRAKGVLGRVVLLDGRTGAVVAGRRVWP